MIDETIIDTWAGNLKPENDNTSHIIDALCSPFGRLQYRTESHEVFSLGGGEYKREVRSLWGD